MLAISEQLKKYRTERGITQEELSEKLFVSRQAISKWEKGEANPDLENVVKLATIFEVSLDELVIGKEPTVKIVEKSKKPMNAWEFLNEESKRPIKMSEIMLFVICILVCIFTVWILTVITK